MQYFAVLPLYKLEEELRPAFDSFLILESK